MSNVSCEKSSNFGLRDRFHPSMQSKPIAGNVWSVRIADHYHAIAQKHDVLVVWFWIGTHEEHNKFVRQVR